MKKSLLSFMLILSVSLFSTKIFAQDVGGGSADGLLPPPPDGGVAAPAPGFEAPTFVLNVKRNNGNATSIGGTAEARLQISKTYSGGDITLVDVSYLDKPGVSLNAVLNGWGYPESGYFSYALKKNVNPAKKLMFYFACSDGTTFCIPETN